MSDENNLKSIIESLLFVSSKPLKIKDLAKILEQPEDLLKTALEHLKEEKKDTGVVLLENNGEYQLATNSKNSTLVKAFLNAELREKLTDATVEVLAIIAYRQPISKAEIEAIRGVNSQYSLRNLLMRGIIEKVANPSDARSFLYQTTTEFLMHMGLSTVKDLPNFESLVDKIKLPSTPQANESLLDNKILANQEPGQNTNTALDSNSAENLNAQNLQPASEKENSRQNIIPEKVEENNENQKKLEQKNFSTSTNISNQDQINELRESLPENNIQDELNSHNNEITETEIKDNEFEDEDEFENSEEDEDDDEADEKLEDGESRD